MQGCKLSYHLGLDIVVRRKDTAMLERDVSYEEFGYEEETFLEQTEGVE